MRTVLEKIRALPGTWLVFFGTVFWSTAGGVSQMFEMDRLLLVGIRALLTGVILLPFLRPKKIVWNRYLFGLIISNTMLMGLIITAIKMSTSANALALQNMAPLWIFLWVFIIQKKKFSPRQFIPVAIMMTGLIAFMMEPNTGSNLLGNILAVMAGWFFAINTVLLQKVEGGGVLSTISLINLCAGIIVLLPLVIAPSYEMVVPSNAWPYIIFLSSVQLAGGNFFYFMGVKKVSSQKATLLSLWEVVLTPLWAFLLIREIPTVYGWVGWLLLIFAEFADNKLMPIARNKCVEMPQQQRE